MTTQTATTTSASTTTRPPATLPNGSPSASDVPWFTDEELADRHRQAQTMATKPEPERLAPLRQRTLLVHLQTSAWTGVRIDRAATRTVEETAGAEKGAAGKFHKTLIRSNELRRIKRIQSRARQRVYRWTLPWADRGPRLAATAHLPKLIGEVRDLEGELGEAVETFLAEYPGHIDDAKAQLGKLFRRHEYPSADELRDAFRLDFHVFQHPPSEDLRLDLDDVDLDYLNDHRQRSQTEAVESATADLLTRLAESLETLHTRLQDPEARLRESLVDNVRHAARLVADYAEGLGLGEAEKILKPVQAITETRINALRHNPATRQNASDEAKKLAKRTAKILQKMQA